MEKQDEQQQQQVGEKRKDSTHHESAERNASKKSTNVKIELHPYLYFNGNAKEAIEFYVKVFNAELKMMKTFGSGPMSAGEEFKDKIMHAAFAFGDTQIMVSDVCKDRESFQAGTNVHLSVSINNDDEKLHQVFHALAEGGTITMPLAKQFWGSTFGSLIDRFGIYWMFSGAYDDKKKDKEATK